MIKLGGRMGTIPNSTIYYKLAVPVDATMGCISTVLSIMVLCLYIQRAGWKKSTDLIFMNIAIVDLTNSLNFIAHCVIMLDPSQKKFFYAAFWIQANVYLLLDPFGYSTKVKHMYIVILCALIWIGSTIDCYLRYDWAKYFKYEVYVTGVVLRIILIVITNATGLTIMYKLGKGMRDTNGQVQEDNHKVDWRRSSFYTSAILSFSYLFCHSYYLYVLLIWTVKGACRRAKTDNPLMYFTGCGAESLSMGHISLLLYSIVTNVIILNQQALRSQMSSIYSSIRSSNSSNSTGNMKLRNVSKRSSSAYKQKSSITMSS
eukprot:sb/3466960/